METTKEYIDDLFINENCDEPIIKGCKELFTNNLTYKVNQYMEDGCSKEKATEKAKADMQKYQTHILCSAIKTFANKYRKMVTLYKRAKISVIVVISALFLCCLFLTTESMSNKSFWIFIWVVVVVICAGILMTMDFLRYEYRREIFNLLSENNLSKEHLAVLGIDFNDGDEEIFYEEEVSEESAETENEENAGDENDT